MRSPLITAALLAAAAAARADLVEIRWNTEHRFEHRTAVAPGQFAEVCGMLAAGERIGWRYTSAPATDFNIHYHEGDKVVYPERRDASDGAQGTLEVPRAQGYCWMWTNRAATAATVRLELRRLH